MDELSSVPFMFQLDDVLEPHNKIIRNRLNLEQRIDVLRQYSKNTDIGQLAVAFQCGRRQIKNILRKRKKYLTMWSRNKHRYDERSHNNTNSFSESLDAVGFVLHEWVARARTYQINITDEILINFGQEIADNIKFKGFRPSREWLMSFKQKYNLTDSHTPSVKQEKLLASYERKPLSISIIIADLKHEYGESTIKIGSDADFHLMDSDGIPDVECSHVKLTKFSSSDSNDSAICIRDGQSNGASSSSSASCMENTKEVKNYREALNQLGPLEQFALLKENIRAVGLINQLENLFREEMIKEGFSI